MPVELTNEERETHLNMTADARGVWEVFSDDPVMMRKLERIGAQVVREDPPGKHYRLTANQVTLRKVPAKREVSEAERQERRERMEELNRNRLQAAGTR